MKTKYGVAKILQGRYRIVSRKEGNNGKLLHRLIWEDFWRTEVPKGYVIHHKDMNPLNNCILNLQLMRRGEHNSLHKKGMTYELSEETKQKMSESRNTTGYLNVCKHKCNSCKQGFIWVYKYSEKGKQKSIYGVNIDKLESKVKSKGLKWKKF